MKDVYLTGDRPTGRLHLGHYVGTLLNRVKIQNSGKYDLYVFIADMQALTDNAKNPKKIKDSIIEVALDYLSVGLDPNKTTIFVQSQIPELCELTFYYMNLVNLGRLQRNPTIKTEIKERGFGKSIPVGFLTYPVSQAADISAFNSKYVPVGDDQIPLVEQCREIVHTFNSIYGETLTMPEYIVPDNEVCRRLPGIDGSAKMSKSANNAIYLTDNEDVLKQKVMSMYTDPKHIKIEDPGNVEGNIVFTYLDAFCKDDSFEKYLPEYKNLNELKEHYKNGGLGDMKIKRFLFEVLNDELKPIRERRQKYSENIDEVYKMLYEGSKKAREVAKDTLSRVRKAIGIEYFEGK